MSGGSRCDRHARLSNECRRLRLERRYRHLLVLYPRAHRREHADEMVGVLLASVTGTPRFGHLADMCDLLAGAFRMRARNTAERLRQPLWLRGTARDQRWSDALAVVSVVAPVLLLVAMLAQFDIPQAAASTATGRPHWPLTGPFYVPDWPLTIGAPLIAALAFGRLRRLAGLVALSTAASQLFLLPAQSIASFESPTLAFTVLLAGSAGAALLLSPGAVRGIALLRWWGVTLIGVIALILGGFSLGEFGLSANTGTYGPALPGSLSQWNLFQPANGSGVSTDLLIAGVLAVVASGCMFSSVGRRVLPLFAIPLIPYAYLWADKLGTDLIGQLGGITAISSSAMMLYLPPALVACLIVTGTRLASPGGGSGRPGEARRRYR